MLACLSAAGCESLGGRATRDAASYPPDFSLVVTVIASAAEQPDPPAAFRPAQHLLEPDRLLRVAFGTGTHAQYYPPPTARLSPGQVAELYRRAKQLRDTAPPSSLSPPSFDSANDSRPGISPTRAGGSAPGDGDRDGAGPTLPPATDTRRVVCQVTLTADRRVSQLQVDPRVEPAGRALLDLLVELRGGR